MPTSKIVKNKSKASGDKFGFNYASLADIQEQGFDVPKMRIRPIFTPDGTTYVGDYMEYYDEETKEWNLGSKVISEKMGSMNAQQSRGSSESYARRYTTLMALGLAGQDDKNVEADGIEYRKKEAKAYPKGDIDFQEVRDEAKMIDDLDSLHALYQRLHVEKMSPAQQKYVNGIINRRKKELEK